MSSDLTETRRDRRGTEASSGHWPSLPRLVLAIAGCQLAGGLGAIATSRSLDSWYRRLDKPSFTPPDWVFGPVWTLLYALMGIALALVIERPARPALKRTAIGRFGLQLGLNVLWSLLFFGRRAPGAALGEIGLLWLAIAGTMRSFARISPLAAALLAPYLLWTSFAALLNAAIWRRNRAR